MDINKQIKELEERIKVLKDIQHNQGMEGVAKGFVKKLKEKATPAELKFQDIAIKKGLNLEFQHKINIYDKDGRIKRFYIVDFCDIAHKIVFEIDGGYHTSKKQKHFDYIRTKTLNKLGYKVFRISNEDVYAGKSTSLILSAYPKLRK